jgi:hypothetical protein
MPLDAAAPAPSDTDSSSTAGRPSLGRPRLFAAWHRLWLRVETSEHADLKAIAALEGKTVTDVVRDAVNEYVGDFREQRVFATRSRSQANRARRERAIPKAAAA